ncbi:MAG: hypothetical protein K2Q01_05135 [Rickettsiales bacterium]|nr:hypothetical protein [Rickettsiales bacterium]
MTQNSSGGHGSQARNPLAIGASKDELSTINTLDNWSNKALPIVMRVASIGALVAAGFFGIGGIIAAGAALVGVELGRAFLHNKADQNRELALYHKDIARVLGKPEGSKLTIQDMYDAADEKKVGDKAIKPLKAELDHLRYRSKFNYIMGAIRAVLTTVVTGLLSGAIAQFDSLAAVQKSPMNLFYTVSGSLMLSGMCSSACESIGWSKFDSNKPPSMYSDLVKLQQIAQQQNVTPEHVFSLAVKSDKGLAAEIEKAGGMAYENMTVRNKKRVIAQYEPRVHAKLLADHINEGANVTIVPLSLAGQLDWSSLPALPAKDASEEPAKSQEQSQGKGKTDKKGFAVKLMESRTAQAEATTLVQLG